ncbi:[NiFe]-hydrogenase assembly chaperone HybE [Alteromonas lipolytica]|uniref:Rubredoxin n=1 Tax=Alteromonas lipolytica TaxID=1856405 RepID=A0A1E8FEF1_9ALTE|nr:[NiFe]-hydrogenase assembly chaperone HybE [Alteromonas lipolytica]OFI34136.1 hypothetical protein BFC17_21565 [Alteromonas lipolytica]GGF65116.1 hypothetical protein GCM10011338_16820 [Alteromonas lipolytica]
MAKGAAVSAFYQSVATNMAELPVYNAKLEVGTTGFLPVDGSWLGVVVTPWCMNIVLVPEVESQHNEFQVGEKFFVTLPSGQYEFIRAYASTLGDYAICSVFSPMFDFTEQVSAMQTAQEVLEALFNEEHIAPSERQAAEQTYREQREIFARQQAEQAATEVQQEVGEEKPALSRRAFLTGSFRGNEDTRI